MTNEEIVVSITDHENQIKSLKHRMDAQEKKSDTLSELTTSVKTLAVNMEYMAKEQQKQGERLERLEQAPVSDFIHYKRVIIGCIVTGIIGAILGAVLSYII